MKVAFFHDVQLIYNPHNSAYYSNGFSYDIWKRYLEVFEELIISTRVVSTNESMSNHKVSSGKRVEMMPIFSYQKTTDFFTRFNSISKEVRRVLSQTDTAIIRLPSVIGLVAGLQMIKEKRSFLVEVVGCAFDAFYYHGSKIGKIFSNLFYMLNRLIISKADYCIYITEEFLQKRYPNNKHTAVISNVTIEQPSKSVLDKRIEKIKNLSRENIKIGLIGSMNVSYKGHDTAIKAIQLVNKKYPHAIIEFVGQKKKGKLPREYNLRNVLIRGIFPGGGGINDWLDEVDIYIQPSKAEAQGRSIIEAMSRACPVIGTKVGGIVELLDEDVLIERGNHEGLARKIIMLIEDKELMIKQAIRNFEEAGKFKYDDLMVKRRSFLNEFREDIIKKASND